MFSECPPLIHLHYIQVQANLSSTRDWEALVSGSNSVGDTPAEGNRYHEALDGAL